MNLGEKFVLRGFNGRPILGDFRAPQSGKNLPLVIFIHGFKGFKDWGHFNQMADYFTSKGFAFLKFNFSHNGGTIHEPIDFPDLEAFSENSFWKEIKDLEAVLDALQGQHEVLEGRKQLEAFVQQIDQQQVHLIGHSRGGGIAILTAARDIRIARTVSWAGVGDFTRYIPKGEQLKYWEDRGVVYVENKRTLQQMPMKYSFVKELIEHQ